MKPVILISSDIVDIVRNIGFVTKSEYSGQISAAGGIPMSPVSVHQAEEYAAFADALVLTDGPAIHPSRYDDYDRGVNHTRADTQRDDLDFALCKAFIAAGKPILGIARGAQVLNICLGGTTNAKLPRTVLMDGKPTDLKPGGRLYLTEPNSTLNHGYTIHDVELRDSSLLPGGVSSVTSFHESGIGKLAQGLKVTGTAIDGTVEAFEAADKPWFGILWNAEHSYWTYQADTALFARFVELAKPFAADPRPRIGCAAIAVNGGPALDAQFEAPGWFVANTYLNAVRAGGGIALLTMERSNTEDYASVTDGLIMTGSANWNPRPAVAKRASFEVNTMRFPMDKALFNSFMALKKPIYGICLGEQRMNQFCGGNISTNFKSDVHNEHMMSEHWCIADEGSLLHRIFGEKFLVNSRHNARVEEVAPCFKVVARAAHDDTIEAIEHESLPIYGFQFHPERTRGDLPDPPLGPDSTPLFEELMKMALERRN